MTHLTPTLLAPLLISHAGLHLVQFIDHSPLLPVIEYAEEIQDSLPIKGMRYELIDTDTAIKVRHTSEAEANRLCRAVIACMEGAPRQLTVNEKYYSIELLQREYSKEATEIAAGVWCASAQLKTIIKTN